MEKLRPIRFGLGGIKGLGTGAAEAIIEERKENGAYNSIFDITTRLSNRVIGRKGLESLIYAGAFDCFDKIERGRYFPLEGTENSDVIELALQYGARIQQDKLSSQFNLFAGGTAVEVSVPEIPMAEPWALIKKLNFEREVIGFYLSAHPLDKYKTEMKFFTNCTVQQLLSEEGLFRTVEMQRREQRLGGVITQVTEKTSQKGSKYGIFTIEDFTGALDVSVFGEDYAKFSRFITQNNSLLILGFFQPGFRNPDIYEFKIRDIQLLDSVLEKLTRELVIELNLKQIEPIFIDNLYNLLNQQPKGGCAVKFAIMEPTMGRIALLSRTLVIKINASIVKALQDLEVEIKLK